MSQNLQKVDHTALKANQLVIIVLALVAFVVNAWWLAGVIALFMVVGAIIGKPGFLFLYRFVFKPTGILKPEIHLDNPEPHRFAQGFGAVVLVAGTLFLYFGHHIIGWGLVWLVIALASLNAFAGFCAGCFVYYQLAKIKVPGFSKLPPEGTFPGLKPKKASGT